MTDFRELILKRLSELDKSQYWLAKRADKMGLVANRPRLFRYLRGFGDTTGEVLAGLFDILMIEVTIRTLPPAQQHWLES